MLKQSIRISQLKFKKLLLFLKNKILIFKHDTCMKINSFEKFRHFSVFPLIKDTYQEYSDRVSLSCMLKLITFINYFKYIIYYIDSWKFYT